MMNDIIHIFITRDGMSRAEAEETFYGMCEEALDGDPEEILADYNLEPDYITDII